MKRGLLFTITYFLFYTCSTNAQNFFHIQNSPLDTISCDSTCITLQAEYLNIRQTTSYNVVSIPYVPNTIGAMNSVSLLDDKFSNLLPLGFNFCFYGNTYSNVVISSNGQLTFNTQYAGQNCSFATQQTLPYYNAEFPDNAIFCPFVDFNVSLGGSIHYATMGAAPFRKFIVSYDSIPYFGGICNTVQNNFYCVLSETYNTIEVYIGNKSLCNTDPFNWLNYATLGIQSSGAMQSITVPGRHAAIWTANNEAWKFEPNGPSAVHTTWYNVANTPLAFNTDVYQHCPTQFPSKVIAKTVYDCVNLTFEDSIVIVKNLPSIDSIHVTPTSCKNISDGSITVYASTFNPPMNYILDNSLPNTIGLFTNVPFGNHHIQVLDAFGCSDSMDITMPTSSTLTSGINITTPMNCPLNLGSICGLMSGGVPPYSYVWSTGDTSLCLNNMGVGNYCFVVTDAVGCKDSTCILFQPQNLPQASAVISKSVCGQNGAIDMTVTGGHPPYLFFWNNGANTEDVSGLTPAFYTVTIIDSLGCSSVYSYNVMDTLQTQANFAFVNPSCAFNNGSITASGYNAIAPYTYQWSTGDTTAGITNQAPGVYTCTITDANGCSITLSPYLPPSPFLEIQFAKANAHCDLLNNGSIQAVVLNASGPLTYQWSTGATTAGIFGLTLGWYTLHVVDSLGCEAIDSIEIGNDGSPHIQLLSYTPPLCFGDSTGSIVFGGMGGAPPYKYSFDGITFYISGNISNVAAGTYPVFIRDANSCLRDSLITLLQPPELIIDSVITRKAACYYDSVGDFDVYVHGGTPPYSYRVNAGLWQSNMSFFQWKEGKYIIEVKDSNGCTRVFPYFHQLQRPSSPLQLAYTVTQAQCYKSNTGGVEVQLTGGWTPYQFVWKNTDYQTLHLENINPGIYALEVYDSMFCRLLQQIEVDQANCCAVFMPNAFTPNNDGTNDMFKVITAHPFQDMRLRIYNRWGQLLYTSFRVEDGWDGTYQGKDSPLETYFYVLDYYCNSTKQLNVLKGDFLLVR